MDLSAKLFRTGTLRRLMDKLDTNCLSLAPCLNLVTVEKNHSANAGIVTLRTFSVETTVDQDNS
jgi:hypothetical protein